MAVIVKYVVVRDGEEKMTFATKKEADAHDKMLDIADTLFTYLKEQALDLSETQMDEISLLMAKEKTAVLQILRGGKPPQPEKTPDKKTETVAGNTSPTKAGKAARKAGPAKAGKKKPAAGSKETPKKAAAAGPKKGR